MSIEKAKTWHTNLLTGAGVDLSATYNASIAGKCANWDNANPWISTSTFATQFLTADFGENVSISSLVVGGHNLDTSTLLLIYSTDDISYNIAASFAVSGTDPLQADFTTKNARYWQLKMLNVSYPAPPQVGEWWLCNDNGVTTFSKFLPGYDPGERKQSAVVTGGPIAAEGRERFSRRRYGVKMDRISKTAADAIVDLFKATGRKPFWFSWDGSDVPTFVQLENKELVARAGGHGRVGLALSLLEVIPVGAVYDDTEEKNRRVNRPVFAARLDLTNLPIRGRATGGSATLLTDSTADFVDRDVMAGDLVYNEFSDLSSAVVSVGITSLSVVSIVGGYSSGDKYVVRAKTWGTSPNVKSFWLTQEELWSGVYPLVTNFGSVDNRIDFDRGKAIMGGHSMQLAEWQETQQLKKLISRKNFDGARLHLYSGYDDGSGVTSTDLDYLGTFLTRQVSGTDKISIKSDSFMGLLDRNLQQTQELFTLKYNGPKADQIEATVDGLRFKVWLNDDADPFSDFDLTETAYNTVQKIRDGLQAKSELTVSAVASGYGGLNSNVINDLDRARFNPGEGLTIYGVQNTYSGTPEEVINTILLDAGLDASEIDTYDIALVQRWNNGWYVEQRPPLTSRTLDVLAELMSSCGGWPRIGKKRDIEGTHTGGDDSADLIDSTASFDTWGLLVGDTVRNLSDGTSATIVSIGATQLILSTGLDFDTGEEYRITGDRDAVSCRILAPPMPGEDPVTVTEEHILEGRIGVEHRVDSYAGQCEVEYDYDQLEGKYNGKVIVKDKNRTYYAKNEADTDDTFRTIKLKAPWLKGGGAENRAKTIADRRLLWQRYTLFKASLEVLLSRAGVEPGDIVSLTHGQLPAVDGGGLTGRNVLVTRTQLKPDMKDMKVNLEVHDAYLGGIKPFIIAPDSVPNWSGATDAQKERYGFITNDQGTMNDGTEGKVFY